MLKSLLNFRLPLTFKQLKILFWLGLIFGIIGILFFGAPLQSFGWLAWWFLLFTIFVSLLHKLFPSWILATQLLPLRKQTGIAAFLVASAHWLDYLVSMQVSFFDWQTMWSLSTQNFAITFGVIATLGMLPLFLTSNTIFIQKLGGKNWKNLQRLTHPIFILAALHIGFVKDETGLFVVLGIYTLGYGFFWLRKIQESRVEHWESKN